MSEPVPQAQPYPAQQAAGLPAEATLAAAPLAAEATGIEPSRKKGLMIAGVTTLAGSYLLSAMVGVQLLTYEDRHSDRTCSSCSTAGGVFLVPIAGPWIALSDVQTDNPAGPAIAIALGAAQAAGLVLTIVGISRYANSSPTRAAASHGWFQSAGLSAAPLPGGGAAASLGGTF